MFLGLFRAILSCFCGSEKPTSPQEVATSVPPQGRPLIQQYQPVSQPVSRPPYNPPAPVERPPTAPRPSPPAARPSPQNLNLQNQQNEHYQSLRARAKDEGAKMAQCFEQSHTAYAARDGARAKELSNEGKAHQREMERLNAEASEWIFTENNKDSKPGEVDLHGLYVKEAITFTERAIQEARQRGDVKVHLIVGKGLHSSNGIAKLRPAIEELMQRQGLVAELEQNNVGVLIVNLNGQPSGEGSVLRAEDIASSLERKDEGCTIM